MSSSVEPTQSTDLSIFSNLEQEPSSKCEDYKSCIAFRRLITALRYYESLKFENDKNNQIIFTSFAQEVYNHSSLIKDFHHFMKQHDEQLYDIIHNGNINKCDITSCSFASRHHRVADVNKLSDDPQLNVYCDTMDSLHFYSLHAFDVGMRAIQREYDNDKFTNNDDVNANTESYDSEFARVTKIISATQSSSDRFERVSDATKFNIEVGDTIENEENDEYEEVEEDMTYRDEIIVHLYIMEIEEDIITKLVQYFKKEQYDTESIDFDARLGKDGGNISKYMADHKECIAALITKLDESQRMLLHYLKYVFINSTYFIYSDIWFL